MATGTTARPRVLASEGGLHLDMLGTLATFKAFTKDTNGAYCLFEGRIMPGEAMPLHYHPNDDECFYILEGCFSFQLGEEKLDAAAGTFAVVPRGTLHGYQNIGDAPGRLLVIVSPGDLYEQHFLRYGREIADPSAFLAQPSSEAIAAAMAEAPRYGIVLASPQRGE
jgi:mannose-6-phosphate isomerase-like protein (cupin superfamily)